MMKALQRPEVLAFGFLGIAIPLLMGLMSLGGVENGLSGILFGLSVPGFFMAWAISDLDVFGNGEIAFTIFMVACNGLAYAIGALALGQLIRTFMDPYVN